MVKRTELRFIIVGIWNTIFGYILFLLLDTLFTGFFQKRYVAYMLALVLGQVIAVISAFGFHKYYTFKSSVKGMNAIQEFFRFSMTYAVTFIVSFISLPILVEVADIHPKVAAGIITLALAMVSYLIHSRYTFKDINNL